MGEMRTMFEGPHVDELRRFVDEINQEREKTLKIILDEHDARVLQKLRHIQYGLNRHGYAVLPKVDI